MADRVYRVALPDGGYRLVLATSRRRAVNYVVDTLIQVRLATEDDIHSAEYDGVEIEDSRGQDLIETSESPAN